MAIESLSRQYSWRPADGEGAMPRRDSRRIARDSSVHQRLIFVLTSDRACKGAVQNRTGVQRQSESGIGWCSVSEILGSSGVRAEPKGVNV
jgi:hypothetical protein